MGPLTIDAVSSRGRGVALLVLLLALVAPPPSQQPAEAATACRAGHVALTFDDGPAPTTTPPVLDILARRQVPATFFVVGIRVDARRDLVARMAREGHAVANHTYHHDRLTGLSDAAILRTVDRTHRAIRDAGASPLRLVRPPYGATSSRVRAVLSRGGYAHILWTVDPRDWESSTTHIRSFVLNNLRDGAVILLHDGSRNAPAMIRALPDIIDGARARGYCFTTLDASGRLQRSAVKSEIDWREHGGPYRDVPPTSTHADAITRLKALAVTQGCGDGRFCPEDQVTRGQMASFLQRALGLPPGPTDGFRDVAPSSPHAAAIGALHQAGITKGCDDGRSYCPNDRIRRDQMASLLQRALALPPGPPDRFADVPSTSTHAAAVGAVHQAGITKGCSADGRLFCPAGRVTRAQTASFVVRALDHLAR
jgi:peptidoglycan/xylan/chitin deacetylase (PgdA/CDA1 family)